MTKIKAGKPARTAVPARKNHARPGTAGKQRVQVPQPQSLSSAEDIDALQHETHGMIEDALDPPPARGGTSIETE